MGGPELHEQRRGDRVRGQGMGRQLVHPGHRELRRRHGMGCVRPARVGEQHEQHLPVDRALQLQHETAVHEGLLPDGHGAQERAVELGRHGDGARQRDLADQRRAVDCRRDGRRGDRRLLFRRAPRRGFVDRPPERHLGRGHGLRGRRHELRLGRAGDGRHVQRGDVSQRHGRRGNDEHGGRFLQAELRHPERPRHGDPDRPGVLELHASKRDHRDCVELDAHRLLAGPDGHLFAALERDQLQRRFDGQLDDADERLVHDVHGLRRRDQCAVSRLGESHDQSRVRDQRRGLGQLGRTTGAFRGGGGERLVRDVPCGQG